MSLDVNLYETVPAKVEDVYWANITHNLNSMAEAAGIYQCLWHPKELGIYEAKQLIEPLTKGIELLKSDPERFEKFDAPNGWGTYVQFVPWLDKLLVACREHPSATVSVSI